jgi:hypothetical protein
MRSRQQIRGARESVEKKVALRIRNIENGILPIFVSGKRNFCLAQSLTSVLTNRDPGDAAGLLVGGSDIGWGRVALRGKGGRKKKAEQDGESELHGHHPVTFVEAVILHEWHWLRGDD